MAATPDATPQSKLVGKDMYDAVLRIGLFKLVYDPLAGWSVAVAPEPEVQSTLAKCAAVRVAPIGVFNAGKTWLLRKLCGDSLAGLPSGEDVHTEGFSVKIVNLLNDKRLCCFLDTEGINSPVLSVAALGALLRVTAGMNVMAAMDSMLQEMKRQETFIRTVAFNFAQVYLVVAGQLSHRDQLELLQLVQQAEQNTQAKRKIVVVVHNLKEITPAEFDEVRDVRRGTYIQQIEQVFKMKHRKVVIGGGPTWIPEMYGAFGQGSTTVTIRHVFLTKDGEAGCKNEAVVTHLRSIIQTAQPVLGNVLGDIARIASETAKSMIRAPQGLITDIRYDESTKRMIAGRLTDDQRKKEAAEAAAMVSPELVALQKALDEADAALAADDSEANRAARAAAMAAFKAVAAPVEQQRRELAHLERELRREGHTATSDERAKLAALEAQVNAGSVDLVAKGRLITLRADALERLSEKELLEVMPRTVMLGSTQVAGSAQHVRYNVTRIRGYLNGTPIWHVMVHMSLPGLLKGELASIKKQLVFDSRQKGMGLTTESISPGQPRTLKLHFTAKVGIMAAKQVAGLNAAGELQRAPEGGFMPGQAVKIAEEARPEVFEAGSRPFPTVAAAVGAAKEALLDDGSYLMDVVIHTEVQHCTSEVWPAVTYSRGILTVRVCTQIAPGDAADQDDAKWTRSTSMRMPVRPKEEGTHGSGDDLSDEDPEWSDEDC